MIQKLEQKARILALLRRFFAERDFLELDTAILQDSLVPELHVASFSLQWANRVKYLLPSPELAMKRVLCDLARAGQARSVYQVAHCFRREEQEDELHSFEFSMLEFYGLNFGSLQLLELVADLLVLLRPELSVRARGALQARPELLSFDDLCQRAVGADFSPYWQAGKEGMYALCQLGYERSTVSAASAFGIGQDLAEDDLFHLFLVDVLEPYIAQNLPYCVLYPYPDVTPLPTRVRSYSDSDSNSQASAWAERWELYLFGVELCNACREENRLSYLKRYARRFQEEFRAAMRQDAVAAKLASYDFAALDLWQDLPDCSGAALGISRLLSL